MILPINLYCGDIKVVAKQCDTSKDFKLKSRHMHDTKIE